MLITLQIIRLKYFAKIIKVNKIYEQNNNQLNTLEKDTIDTIQETSSLNKKTYSLEPPSEDFIKALLHDFNNRSDKYLDFQDLLPMEISEKQQRSKRNIEFQISNKPKEEVFFILQKFDKSKIILIPNCLNKNLHKSLREVQRVFEVKTSQHIDKTQIKLLKPATISHLGFGIFNLLDLGQIEVTIKIEKTPVKTNTKPRESASATINLSDRRVSVRKPEKLSEDLGDGIFLEMIALPGGSFLMGSPDSELARSSSESPMHLVIIPPFFVSKYPITQAQWRAVVSKSTSSIELRPNPSKFNGDYHPVESINWYEAVEFCNRLLRVTGKNYRLLSEAEWEYACRAGTASPFFWGNTLASCLANYNATFTYGSGEKGKFRQQTTRVDLFPPNSFGLYDMHGNVWEWCADRWHDSYKSAPEDGKAWSTGSAVGDNVVRGGSWASLPSDCRSASRTYRSANLRSDDRGFRVALSL
uniref:formylglycine-generating enzyme family protein n=1 Tax=Petrachloros mirabilis TaxID=2918835 RepID=UPI001EE87DB5|nr:formylglycine-generating enzyme family protein [Petrachloros mirabilis]